MPTTLEKIRAGIAAADRQKTDPYHHLVEVPQTTAALSNLAARAKILGGRYKTFADGIKSAVEKHRAEAEATFAQVGKSTDENGVTTDPLGAIQRRQLVENSVRDFRRNVALKVGEIDRAEILAELKTINRKIQAVADLHNDAVGILMGSTLGSKRRSDFAQDLRHSGPRELELAANKALVTGDKDLLAACFGRLDSMDKKTRELVKLSRHDSARHLVGDQLNVGLSSIALAEVSLDTAMMLDDEIEGRKVAPSRKIGLGLKKQKLAEMGIDIESEDAVKGGETGNV